MAIKGYAFITRPGTDPERGKSLKDPYLGNPPSLGACMPHIRRQVVPGDHLFVISGKLVDVPQYMIGGFEVAEKIKALTAYKNFPEQRLHKAPDGQLVGNVIVNSRGKQHSLDSHSNFERRIENYVVGRDPIVLTAPDEIERARQETLYVLRQLLGKRGTAPIHVVGRASRLNEEQVIELRDWLLSLKSGH